jgi:Iron only nitrogenase protein AnfO (AnfO_nitrog)
MKIAVLVDERGVVLPFFSSGLIQIYSDHNHKWEKINDFPHYMDREITINDVREKAQHFIAQLDDCNQIILKNVIGFAKPVLEEYNVSIWIYKGELSLALLNHIRTKSLDVNSKQAQIIPSPKLESGIDNIAYILDLSGISVRDVESEVREAFVSFLQNTHFDVFIILSFEKLIWIKVYTELFELEMIVKLLDNELWKISLIPKDIDKGLTFRKLIKLSQMPGHEDCSNCNTSGVCISEKIKTSDS